MLAWMSAASLRQTQETGFVHFFSRSRQALWKKGETSGNTLALVDIVADCDHDTVLVTARPAGPVCHTGSATCFDDGGTSGGFLRSLDALIARRRQESEPGSYTASLFARGTSHIARKVGEEAVEVALAAVADDDEAFLGEAADLLYHLQVLLADRGMTLTDVEGVLAARHEKSMVPATPR